MKDNDFQFLIKRVTPILIALAVVAFFFLGGLSWLGSSAVSSLLAAYPKPAVSDLPPSVPDPIEALLERFENAMREQAPGLLDSLNPGLSDEELKRIEMEGRFTLPPDLRALYLWRNGMPRERSLPLFTYHHFVPLEEAVIAREAMKQDVRGSTFSMGLLKHRLPWLGLIEDLAGDGYFYDTERGDSPGSFFFNFNETSEYVFYPRFGNFLAETLDAIEDGSVKFTSDGCTIIDLEAALSFRNQHGRSYVGDNPTPIED